MPKRLVIEPIEDALYAHIVNAVANSFDGTASQIMPEEEQAKIVGSFLFDAAAETAKKHASIVGQKKAATQIETYANGLIADARQKITTTVQSIEEPTTENPATPKP